MDFFGFILGMIMIWMVTGVPISIWVGVMKAKKDAPPDPMFVESELRPVFDRARQGDFERKVEIP